MNLPTNQLLLQLAANRPLPLKKARGVRVHCVEGVVWMTVAGVPGDIFLRAGQSFRIPCNGLALIEALPEARVRLEAPVLQLRAGWRMFRNKITGMAGRRVDITSQASPA